MKKVTITLLITLMLVGCSTPNIQKEPDTSTLETVSTVENKEQVTKTQEPLLETPTQMPTSNTDQPIIDNNWFAGTIGDAKIHAKIEILDDKISGVYYYDQYKTNIKLEGYIDKYDRMKDFNIISLTEDTDKRGKIVGVLKTNDYIEGYWESGKTIYPMYLIREGLDITSPKKPSAEVSKFDGYWTGKKSEYFINSSVFIKVLFDDLIFYDLEGHNGTHSGGAWGFGIISNGSAKTVFQNTTYDEKKENVFFEFKIEDNLLKLNSNMYDYGCGAGVMFDSEYVYGEIDIPMPTALEVGIVETEEQEEVFKKLVGDKYSRFINYTSYAGYSEAIMDGEKVKYGTSYLRGANECCKYIISSKYIYAAVVDYDGIHYFTNDKNYAEKIPEPMTEWTDTKVGNIIYHYKE